MGNVYKNESKDQILGLNTRYMLDKTEIVCNNWVKRKKNEIK